LTRWIPIPTQNTSLNLPNLSLRFLWPDLPFFLSYCFIQSGRGRHQERTFTLLFLHESPHDNPLPCPFDSVQLNSFHSLGLLVYRNKNRHLLILTPTPASPQGVIRQVPRFPLHFASLVQWRSYSVSCPRLKGLPPPSLTRTRRADSPSFPFYVALISVSEPISSVLFDLKHDTLIQDLGRSSMSVFAVSSSSFDPDQRPPLPAFPPQLTKALLTADCFLAPVPFLAYFVFFCVV